MTNKLTSLADLDPHPQIDLDFYSHNEKMTREDAKKIVGKMAGRHVSLSLVGTSFEEGALQIILNGLFSISSGKNISFKSCGLQDRDVVLLAHLIQEKQVASLVLSDNVITDNGARVLATALKLSQVDLTVRENYIGPQGAVELVKAWSARGDTSIDLSYNLLGNEGAKKVAQTLAASPGLIESVCLDGNEIDAEGDAALAKYLPSSVSDIFYRTQEVDFAAFQKAFVLGALLEYGLDKAAQNKSHIVSFSGLDHPRAHPPSEQANAERLRNEQIRALLGWT